MKKTNLNIMQKPVIADNLGVVCVVDLRGIRTTVEEAKKLLNAAGLPETEVSERKGKGALKEVLKEFEGGQILVEVASNPAWVDYQLNLSKMTESDGIFTEAEISKVAVVRLYKDNNVIETDNPELTGKIREIFDREIKALKTAQIKAVIDRIINKYGEWVNLTAKGGVYFVPNHPQYLDLMAKIKVFCDKIGAENYMSILPVANNEGNKKDYWKKISESLEKKAADLKAKVAIFADDVAKNPDAVTLVKGNNVLAEIQMLEAQADGYELLFSELQEKVRAQINEAKEKFTNTLAVND